MYAIIRDDTVSSSIFTSVFGLVIHKVKILFKQIEKGTLKGGIEGSRI